MNFVFRNFAAILCTFTICVPTTSGQQSQSPTKARLMEVALEIMDTSRYSALITRNPSGSADARTVDPFPPDEDMVIWIGTNPRSRKVAQIRSNPRVALYYFDREGQGYVTIHGTARVINDPGLKAKWWKDEWKAFYPDRNRDYTLIAVTPHRLEVISEKHRVMGNPTTWAPPSINLSPTSRRRLKNRAR